MDYYRQLVLEPDRTDEDVAMDELYVERMRRILSAVPCVGVPREPTAITGMVYLGSTANAENLHILKEHNIKYILNCSGGSYVRFKRIRDIYGPQSGILGYDEIPADDDESFNIRAYFDRANGFIDNARVRNGRVLIHCPGVSRSGAIALAYLIHQGTMLLEATQLVKEKRRNALCNNGFMYQLAAYARERGMLDPNVKAVAAPRYHTQLNRYRIMSSSLPTVW